MSGPTCRSCYIATLSPDQLQQFAAEPVTGSIYLCPPHQEAQDAFLAKYADAFIAAPYDKPLTFREFAPEVPGE